MTDKKHESLQEELNADAGRRRFLGQSLAGLPIVLSAGHGWSSGGSGTQSGWGSAGGGGKKKKKKW